MPKGTATLSFGSTPTDEASVEIDSGDADVTAAEAWWLARSTSDNGTDEHEEGSALCLLVCTVPAAGIFTAKAHCLAMLGIGDFTIDWVAD
jgi:hypothetical protein